MCKHEQAGGRGVQNYDLMKWPELAGHLPRTADCVKSTKEGLGWSTAKLVSFSAATSLCICRYKRCRSTYACMGTLCTVLVHRCVKSEDVSRRTPVSSGTLCTITSTFSFCHCFGADGSKDTNWKPCWAAASDKAWVSTRGFCGPTTAVGQYQNITALASLRKPRPPSCPVK